MNFIRQQFAVLLNEEGFHGPCRLPLLYYPSVILGRNLFVTKVDLLIRNPEILFRTNDDDLASLETISTTMAMAFLLKQIRAVQIHIFSNEEHAFD